MRLIAFAILAVILLGTAFLIGQSVPQHHIHHHPGTFGNGCDVSLTIPNPCDPDSNN